MRKKAFQAAFPYTIPIFAGFWFLALAYGIYMNANGFPYPMLMSLLIYGGSLEFVAVEITKEPKTFRRTVSIPHFLTQRIKALRRERLKYRLTLGDYWQGGEWLFIQETGDRWATPPHTRLFRTRSPVIMQTSQRRSSFPPFRSTASGNTSATLLIAGKQDVRTVSSRLGHAQASMNIYAHALSETDRKASNALENMLAAKAR